MVNSHCLLEVFRCHSNQLEIASVLLNGAAVIKQSVWRVKSERNAALDADIAVEAPAADQTILPSASIA